MQGSASAFGSFFSDAGSATADGIPTLWIVRLHHREMTSYGQNTVGERPTLTGSIGNLAHDLINDDRKGLRGWLHKHVEYSRLEAEPTKEPSRMVETSALNPAHN